MAEEFETGICGASSWWNNLMMVSNNLPSSRTGGGFIGGGGSSLCSDFGSWVGPDLMMMSSACKDVVVVDVAAAVSNNSSVSDGSAVFQNDSDSGGSTGGGCVMMDSCGLQLMGFGGGLSSSSPSSSADWNHRLMNDQRMDDSQNYDWCNRTAAAADDPLNNLSAFCNIDQQQQQPSLNDNLAVANSTATSYGYPSTLIQSLFEPDDHPHNQPPPPPPIFSNSLLFNGGGQFWDSSAATSSTTSHHHVSRHEGSMIRGHAQARFGQPMTGFEQKPTNTCPTNVLSTTTTTTKQPKKEEGSGKEAKSGSKKGSHSSGSEPAFKRPRIETPSPLPTFKVRKEKLGDRITALQQLVSPFGKTDTASVLHEAIEYIKFLHDQVLSTPYMKNGNPIHQRDHKLDHEEAQTQQDLRTRGLCLVPISSTFPVASETTADFWTPTFGGSFR